MKRAETIKFLTLLLLGLLAGRGVEAGTLTTEEKHAFEAIAAIYAKAAPFSASVRSPTEPMPRLGNKISVSDGKVRIDSDLSEFEGMEQASDGAREMKEMGLDRSVSIYDPRTRMFYMMFPAHKAYCRIKFEVEGRTPQASTQNVSRTRLGEEPIDGHRCDKYKLRIPMYDGAAFEFETWEATDLKGFPVQFAFREGAGTNTLRLVNIRWSKPPPSEFEIPSGYTGYTSFDELMAAVMLGAMQREGMKPEDLR